MANYIERDTITTNKVVLSQQQMCQNYENMLNNVTDMINKEGPIISTWIKFQIGSKNNKNPIIFDSSSTNPKKNLIASLSFNKNGAGTANSFTLVIQYDPFNMGQETADIIEQLDEYVANAMSYDFLTDLDTMRGFIQYGYNAVSDNALVSPLYMFYLINANTEVKFESGISTYTFEGVSIIGADSDNVAKFPAVENKKLLQVVIDTLYYWYGDNTRKPAHLSSGIEPIPNDYKYGIDISDDDFNDSVTIESEDEKSGMSPIQYCQDLLNKYNLTESEKTSEIYNDYATTKDTLSYAQQPRYIIYFDDASQTIRITHVVPKVTRNSSGDITEITVSEEARLKIDYKFYWGQQTQNIVIGWKPEVDTRLYLIRRARTTRYKTDLEQAEKSGNEQAIKGAKLSLEQNNDDLNEMFDAQLQILGIPADPPLGALIPIIPTILETPSRTAGYYMIQSCSDNITTNGVYTTTLRLFRIRGIDDPVKELTIPETDTQQPNSTTETNSTPNTDGSGSSFSSGGGDGRRSVVAGGGR